jgi:L-2-hydroxyglutarate oxidase
MTGNVDFDVVVIGGGIVGLASAYKIASNHPSTRIAVLEKEDRLAAHQTGHNSGVIHSGLYYKPASNKARTCAEGRKQLVDFAREHAIPHQITGKIVVASEERELPELDRLLENGRLNAIEGIEKIGPEQIKEIEPACTGIAGVRVPCTGIIDFVKVAEKLAELIEATGNGNKVLLSHEARSFDKHDFYTAIPTGAGTIKAKHIINCAGLQCDRVARMDGLDPGLRIVPFRGDYFQLTQKAGEKVRTLIYPVPDPSFPFLGVHFTRMMDGSVECGPNAIFSFKREGYRKTDFAVRDAWDSLSYWGTWRLFLRHWKYGLTEYRRALFRGQFLRQLQRLIPSLDAEDLVPGKAGVRAQALGPDGELLDDFRIEIQGNSIHVLNAPSPAATASLAIADQIAEIAAKSFRLETPKKLRKKTAKRKAKAKAAKKSPTKAKKRKPASRGTRRRPSGKSKQ